MHSIDHENQTEAGGESSPVLERQDCNGENCGGADCGSCIVARELAYSWSGA